MSYPNVNGRLSNQKGANTFQLVNQYFSAALFYPLLPLAGRLFDTGFKAALCRPDCQQDSA